MEKFQYNTEEHVSEASIEQGSTVSTAIKRFIDILGALVGLIILLPVMVVFLCFYLFGENKGPVFFKQVRIGKNGKTFFIYKFRTMVENAEEKLSQDNILYKNM